MISNDSALSTHHVPVPPRREPSSPWRHRYPFLAKSTYRLMPALGASLIPVGGLLLCKALRQGDLVIELEALSILSAGIGLILLGLGIVSHAMTSSPTGKRLTVSAWSSAGLALSAVTGLSVTMVETWGLIAIPASICLLIHAVGLSYRNDTQELRYRRQPSLLAEIRSSFEAEVERLAQEDPDGLRARRNRLLKQARRIDQQEAELTQLHRSQGPILGHRERSIRGYYAIESLPTRLLNDFQNRFQLALTCYKNTLYLFLSLQRHQLPPDFAHRLIAQERATHELLSRYAGYQYGPDSTLLSLESFEALALSSAISDRILTQQRVSRFAEALTQILQRRVQIPGLFRWEDGVHFHVVSRMLGAFYTRHETDTTRPFISGHCDIHPYDQLQVGSFLRALRSPYNATLHTPGNIVTQRLLGSGNRDTVFHSSFFGKHLAYKSIPERVKLDSVQDTNLGIGIDRESGGYHYDALAIERNIAGRRLATYLGWNDQVVEINETFWQGKLGIVMSLAAGHRLDILAYEPVHRASYEALLQNPTFRRNTVRMHLFSYLLGIADPHYGNFKVTADGHIQQFDLDLAAGETEKQPTRDFDFNWFNRYTLVAARLPQIIDQSLLDDLNELGYGNRLDRLLSPVLPAKAIIGIRSRLNRLLAHLARNSTPVTILQASKEDPKAWGTPEALKALEAPSEPYWNDNFKAFERAPTSFFKLFQDTLEATTEAEVHAHLHAMQVDLSNDQTAPLAAAPLKYRAIPFILNAAVFK